MSNEPLTRKELDSLYCIDGIVVNSVSTLNIFGGVSRLSHTFSYLGTHIVTVKYKLGLFECAHMKLYKVDTRLSNRDLRSFITDLKEVNNIVHRINEYNEKYV